MTLSLKKIADHKVLFVMAVDAEYGDHLKSRIEPLMCGVGPVEAALATSLALSELKQTDQLPDLLVTLGSAGSRALEQAEVYQATSVSYRDMDASALGFEKGATPFLDMPIAIPLPFEIPQVPKAKLSTGANVVSGAQYDAIDADMVDMETFAIWRVCHQFGVPIIALRGISDGKEDLEKLSDWTEYLHVIDEKLATTLDLLSYSLEHGLLRGD
jgi:adenosylhomocysteine nucleosidase